MNIFHYIIDLSSFAVKVVRPAVFLEVIHFFSFYLCQGRLLGGNWIISEGRSNSSLLKFLSLERKSIIYPI